MKRPLIVILVAIALAPFVLAAPSPNKNHASAEIAVQSNADESTARVEGEKRFRANCSRCHQAPHKFPPRMIVTVERHMRVRALVTEDDMRLILHYLTQ